MAVTKAPEQRVFNAGDVPTDPAAAAQVEQLRAALDEANKRINALVIENEAEKMRLAPPSDVEEVRKEYEAERALAREAADRAQKALAERATELGNLRADHAKLKRELANMRAQRDTARDQLDQAKAKIAEMTQARTGGAVKAGPGVKTDDLGTL